MSTRWLLLTLLLAGCIRGGFDASAPTDAAGGERGPDSAPRDAIQEGTDGFSGCEACPLGCDATQSHCRRLVPANVEPSAIPAPCPVLDVAKNAALDTTVCALGACKGRVLAAGCVIAADGLWIHDAATLRVSGASPLLLLIERQALIAGTLDAAAQGPIPGPAGGAGGVAIAATTPQPGGNPGGGLVCKCTDEGADDCGGGGGGHGSAGADGGKEGTCGGSLGGSIHGSAALVPLSGGGGGASGGNVSPNAKALQGAGGGGGGALQISAQHSIRVDGVITAGGGGGKGGACPDSYCSGGGGGAGGAVLLEAPRIDGQGWVAANGGGGGGGASQGNADHGADATTSNAPAAGGAGVGSGGDGGDGATGDASAAPGADGPTWSGAGGGGGGGAGRVRLNLPPGVTVDLQVGGILTRGAVVAR